MTAFKHICFEGIPAIKQYPAPSRARTKCSPPWNYRVFLMAIRLLKTGGVDTLFGKRCLIVGGGEPGSGLRDWQQQHRGTGGQLIVIHPEHALRLHRDGLIAAPQGVFTYVNGFDGVQLTRLRLFAQLRQTFPDCRLLAYLVQDFDPTHRPDIFLDNARSASTYYGLGEPDFDLLPLSMAELEYRQLRRPTDLAGDCPRPEGKMTTGLLLIHLLLQQNLAPTIAGFGITEDISDRDEKWHDLKGEAAWLSACLDQDWIQSAPSPISFDR